MDKLLLLVPLLLLGLCPFETFRGVAPATLCMVCNKLKSGHCLRGKGNCTVEQGPGCQTRDFFIFTEKDGWSYDHTELDCSDYCSPSNFYNRELKISTFCCKGQDFCNIYQGKGWVYNVQ